MKVHAIVAYNGYKYSGWQKQANFISVQETIEKVLSQYLNNPTSIYSSGRTDAGVHAYEQHFHFEVNKVVDLTRFKYSANVMLPDDIKILSFEQCDDSFHARFSCKKKEYVYKICLVDKDPFYKDFAWLYSRPFDFELFKEALRLFKGKHNFKNFTSKEEDEQDFIRKILEVSVLKTNENSLEVSFLGNGFMRYQIRFMVATSMAVATKIIPIDYIKEKIDKDSKRVIVHYKAPPWGLYLKKVFY